MTSTNSPPPKTVGDLVEWLVRAELTALEMYDPGQQGVLFNRLLRQTLLIKIDPEMLCKLQDKSLDTNSQADCKALVDYLATVVKESVNQTLIMFTAQ